MGGAARPGRARPRRRATRTSPRSSRAVAAEIERDPATLLRLRGYAAEPASDDEAWRGGELPPLPPPARRPPDSVPKRFGASGIPTADGELVEVLVRAYRAFGRLSTLRAVRRLAFVALLAALVTAGSARAGTGMFVGATEDNVRSLSPLTAKSKMDLAALAGLDTVRMSRPLAAGRAADRRRRRDRAAERVRGCAARRRAADRLALSRATGGRLRSPRARAAQFASYAASIAQEFPAIRDFIVGNEPNLNLFWMPQFGLGGVDLAARSYELLLARTYDALKLGLRRRERDRRRARVARPGQARLAAADAFADRVHQGPRRRVPRDEARRVRSWTCSRSIRT